MADETFTDPLGRVITLHDHTWFGHVLKRRPDMHAMRRKVGAAIRSPATIRISTSDPDTRLYYGQPTPTGIMMVVAADVVAGHVLTAYRTRKPKGAVEWP